MSINSVGYGSVATYATWIPATDPFQDYSVPSWFNSDIPNSLIDPSLYEGQGLLDKIYEMVLFMRDHQGNLKAVSVFNEFFKNMAQSNLMSNPEIVKMLSGLSGKNSVGEEVPVYQALIDSLARLHFFETGDASTAFLKGLEIINPQSQLSQDYNNYIETHWLAKQKPVGKSNWDRFIEANSKDGVPKHSAEIEYILEAGYWATFAKSSGVKLWLKSMRCFMIDTICDDPKNKNNVYLQVEELVMFLQELTLCDQVSSYNDLSKHMQELTTDGVDLSNQWNNKDGSSAGNNDGVDFMTKLEDLKLKVDGSAYLPPDFKKRFDTYCAEIENTSVGTAPTFLALYTDAMSGSSSAASSASRLNTVYGAIHIPDPVSHSPNKSGSQIELSQKSMMGCMTDSATSNTTALTKVTSDVESFENTINKILNGDTGYVGLFNALVRNQAKA